MVRSLHWSLRSLLPCSKASIGGVGFHFALCVYHAGVVVSVLHGRVHHRPIRFVPRVAASFCGATLIVGVEQALYVRGWLMLVPRLTPELFLERQGVSNCRSIMVFRVGL